MSDMEKAMSQMLADMTPKKLPTNEEIFGKGASWATPRRWASPTSSTR